MKLAFFISLLFLFAFSSLSQSITKNQVDDFTGNKVIRGDWEVLSKNMKFSAFYRLGVINDTYVLDLKMMLGMAQVFSISKGAELMLKMAKTGEIVTLVNTNYAITCAGCGARGFAGSAGQGLKTTYILSATDVDKIITNDVEKVRIYTSGGYVGHKITPKNADLLRKGMALLTEYKDK